jgi:hypothetical protein
MIHYNDTDGPITIFQPAFRVAGGQIGRVARSEYHEHTYSCGVFPVASSDFAESKLKNTVAKTPPHPAIACRVSSAFIHSDAIENRFSLAH